MHQRNAENPVNALPQSRLDFRRLAATRLKPEQTGDGLKIIFDPVMNLLDYRRFNQQFLFFFSQLRDISDKQQHPQSFSRLYDWYSFFRQNQSGDFHFHFLRLAGNCRFLRQTE